MSAIRTKHSPPPAVTNQAADLDTIGVCSDGVQWVRRRHILRIPRPYLYWHSSQIRGWRGWHMSAAGGSLASVHTIWPPDPRLQGMQAGAELGRCSLHSCRHERLSGKEEEEAVQGGALWQLGPRKGKSASSQPAWPLPAPACCCRAVLCWIVILDAYQKYLHSH